MNKEINFEHLNLISKKENLLGMYGWHIIKIYECYCGKGYIISERSDEMRTFEIFISCKDCTNIYENNGFIDESSLKMYMDSCK
jgi:hypothetical protein